MKIITIGKNVDEIMTKEELINLLKKYKGILTPNMLEYLNSLIELEFSVIREYISNDERKVLSELEAYKRIAMYNIYNRALNLVNQNESWLYVYPNHMPINEFSIKAREVLRNVFEFDYRDRTGFSDIQISSGCRSMKVGDIRLYQMVADDKQREKALTEVMKKLERLYNEKNPYSYRRGYVGGPHSYWNNSHYWEIKKYEEKFTELDSKKELTDEEKRRIEVTKQFYDLILEDYGLTDESFSNGNFAFDTLETEKVRVKKMHTITLEHKIEYI